MDLTGKTCDKIGTSFTAFRYQERGCTQEQSAYVSLIKVILLHMLCLYSQLQYMMQTGYSMAIMCVLMQTNVFHLYLRRCLHNQPIHFWEEDNVSMPAHMHMYAHSFVLSLPNTSLYVHMYMHSPPPPPPPQCTPGASETLSTHTYMHVIGMCLGVY